MWFGASAHRATHLRAKGNKARSSIMAFFVWYELTTSDLEAAMAFYTKLVGWGTRDVSRPSLAYTVFTLGEAPVSGLITLPEDARKMGAKPRWIGYLGVDDVDATVDR